MAGLLATQGVLTRFSRNFIANSGESDGYTGWPARTRCARRPAQPVRRRWRWSVAGHLSAGVIVRVRHHLALIAILAVILVRPPLAASHPADFSGVFRSDDGGRTWHYLTSSPPVGAVFALAIDPARPSVVYAGTDLLVWRSDDSGGDWRLLGAGLDGQFVLALAIEPDAPGRLFAATDEGLYRSPDAGRLFERLDVPGGRPLSLAASGRFGLLVGTTDGIAQSRDGGSTWAAAPVGLPGGAVFSVAEIAGRLHATTTAGPYWSDEGRSWRAARQAPPGGIPRAIAGGPDGLFTATGERAYRSGDGGETWAAFGLPLSQPASIGDVHPTRVVPLDQSRLLGLTRRGLFASHDDGATWRLVPIFEQLTHLETGAVAIAPGDPPGLCVGASGVQ